MSEAFKKTLTQTDCNLAEHRRLTVLLQQVNYSLKNHPMVQATEAPTGIQIDCDYILVRRTDGLLTWEGMGEFDNYEADRAFSTEQEAIANAQQELAELNLPEFNIPDDPQLISIPQICPFGLEGDFTIEQTDDGLWHWEGLAGSACKDYCSEEGHSSQRYAVADALFELSRLVLNYDDDQAITVVLQQSLPCDCLVQKYGVPVPSADQQIEEVKATALAYINGSASAAETLEAIATIVGIC